MILIVDSFFTGSHRYWGEELKKRLPFETALLTLSGKNWKWRMQGGAFELAEKFKKLSKKPSLIIATDMVNLPLFYAFAGITKETTPCLLYFHENQFSYPVSDLDGDKKAGRENHYAFMNLTSALFAKELIFNSDFNRSSFLKGARNLIKALPNNNLKLEDLKTSIIYPGIVYEAVERNPSATPTILWNHRWEHDKNPELFLKGIGALKQKEIKFKLIIVGKGTETERVKQVFKTQFKEELIHCGYAESKAEYLKLISQANILPVTSKHDFFGISVAEAMQAGAYSILPNHQAYPEHLAENNSSGILYDFPNGFEDALLNAVGNNKNAVMKDDFSFDAVVLKWEELIANKLNIKRV